VLALVVLATVAGCGDGTAPPGPTLDRLRLGAVVGAADDAGFARAKVPRSFEFPRDYGPHPSFRSEWWYLTMMLEDAEGREFGAQFTAFRQALAPVSVSANPWQTNQVYLAHLGLTDVAAGRHLSAERLARGHPALAGARAQPFGVWLEDWILEERGSSWWLSARAPEFALSLAVEPVKPVVLQGEGGLSRKGPNQASYYYSIPRLSVAGTVSVGDDLREVHGSAWFDREWSTSVLGQDHTGWDWLALQLDDGSEFMGFRLRREDGRRDPYDHGLAVAPDGDARRLGAEDFRLLPERFWRDPHGTSWPVSWTVELATVRWRVTAALDDQRMDTAIDYWEGLVHVFDPSGARIGRGYMELTGYGDE